jgi:molecular chaperone DnaK (HSP70)
VDFNEIKHLIEDFFNGKFEVKKFLGEGSFAKVYLVNHNYLDTLMAMKIIKEPLSTTNNKKDIFSEVTLACQLRHENIISIYDAAEITDFEDGKSHAYFVMEYVSGGDLEQYHNSFVENNMFMPIERSLDLIRQILRGLNTLHSANPPIVHRDLKPNNVLLSFNASGDIIIKISDFGFAKEVTTSISDIDIAGTRPYMAPELFSKSISARSDIYAVGVIFYQLLTNRYPYDVDDFTNEELVNLKPWDNEPKPPSHYNEKVFKDLDSIVMKCLEADSYKRYDDAHDLLADVERAIDEYESIQIVSKANIEDTYHDDYYEYIINDCIKEAFELAKHENKLDKAIEILEGEVLQDYHIRKCYSETLRIWKSSRPDLKLISKAFTVNLKGRNYRLSCNLLKEAIAYNPSLKNKYGHYIDLWNIFLDLQSHGSLFKSAVLLENLMESSSEIKGIYEGILPAIKTCSVDEIVVEALKLVSLNDLSSGANLMEFAVVCDAQVRQKYSYKMSLWKQNMKMHFKRESETKNDSIDYAIDLGTTDSVLSYFNDGDPVIIKNRRTGDEFTPSAILIDDEDNVEVGLDAKNAILENNHNAVSEFKNNMGFSVPFRFEKSSRVMFPEELSAEVLKDLRLSAYVDSGEDFEHAVICVPANSNPIKTMAINDAAELAGLRSHPLILEPVAVSLAYDLSKNNGIWMIYDLGGGTFNASLIRDNDGEIEKLATDGLDNFGGNAFDWKIVNDLFRPKIIDDLKLDDFRRDNHEYLKAFARLKDAAEAAKKDLTKFDEADISLMGLLDEYDFRYTLTRETLKQTLNPLIRYTFKLCRNILDENSLAEDDLESIILVGGSSLSPIVQESISKEFNTEIQSSIDPLTVVARGAAIYAGSIEKPNVEVKNQPLSILLNRQNSQITGKVFSNDLKTSFLGCTIEFENNENSLIVPLNIDGTFKAALNDSKYEISVYDENNLMDLDEKSPAYVHGGKIFIPYFNYEFDISNDSSYNDISLEYSQLIKELDSVIHYLEFDEDEMLEYIQILLEISRRNQIAVNQAEIYINYLNYLVEDAKKDMEFSILFENVSEKISFVEENDLFEIEGVDEVSEDMDFDELKGFHTQLIEKYVKLNRNRVIEECYFNLKFNGIYLSNEEFASELFENAEKALNEKDYDELFSIVNLLYEIDERLIK